MSTLEWNRGLGSGAAWAAWALAVHLWDKYGLELGCGDPVDEHAEIDPRNFAYRVHLEGGKSLEIRVAIEWDVDPNGERWVDRSKCVDFSFALVGRIIP